MNKDLDEPIVNYHQLENLKLKLENEMLKRRLKDVTNIVNGPLGRDFYLTILDNIPSDIVVWDRDHNYIYVNPRAIKDPETRRWIIGKNDFDYCKLRKHPVELAEGRRTMFNKVKESREGIVFEEKMRAYHGTYVWNIRHMNPIYDENQQLIFVIGYASDITHLKKIEEELILSSEKAEESFRTKEEFIANMSHEIRTPMNGILGMSDLLLKTNVTGKTKSYIESINKGAKNLLVVINDILDFTKIRSNKLELENVEVNLEKELKDLEMIFNLKCVEKDISLHVEIDEILKKNRVQTDPVRLNQILNNLLSNAIKFTDKGEVNLKVKIQSEKQDSYEISFSIADTGIGISKEHLDKIFKPFSQADNSVTRKYGGTGLGLSITKMLTNLIGGELQVKSEINKGSEFFFTATFPKGSAVVPSKSIESSKHFTPSPDFSVLIVEDNPMNQIYAQALLEEITTKIEIANNGQEAIDILQTKNFSLILMDIQMPVMGGEECTKIIRNQLNLSVPIVALTANAFKEDEVKYLSLGMNGYLSKPFSEKELHETFIHLFSDPIKS